MSLFENALIEYDIEYQLIRIGTPQHNGKVERQHRIDEMRFYKYSACIRWKMGADSWRVINVCPIISL